MKKERNEWRNEFTNKRTYEPTNKRANEVKTSERRYKRANEGIAVLNLVVFENVCFSLFSNAHRNKPLRNIKTTDSKCSYSLFILLIVFPGLVADKTNSYPTAFLCAGGIEAVGVLILLIFICVRRVEFSQTKIQTDSENSSSTVLLVIEKETVL